MKDIVIRLRSVLHNDRSVEFMNHEAADEIVRLRAERDEARREILLWVKERCSWVELAEEIKKRGWEYLKEDGK